MQRPPGNPGGLCGVNRCGSQGAGRTLWWLLEGVLQPELNVAGTADLSADDAEACRSADVAARSAPAHEVQRIEELRAELEPLGLFDVETLADRGVHVEEAGGALGTD